MRFALVRFAHRASTARRVFALRCKRLPDVFDETQRADGLPRIVNAKEFTDSTTDQLLGGVGHRALRRPAASAFTMRKFTNAEQATIMNLASASSTFVSSMIAWRMPSSSLV